MSMSTKDLERIYREHGAALFGFLVYRTGSREAAEDALSDTFERALRGRRTFDRIRGSEKTWIYGIALNLLRDDHRHRLAEYRALALIHADTDEVLIDPRIAAAEAMADLSLALATLDADECEAVALRYGGDLTIPEIAALLGEAKTTVHGRVYRGLRKLRTTLEGPAEPTQRVVAGG